MTISDVLKMGVGQGFGGLDVTIKTCKKKWQVGKDWVHQVVLSDKSGDTLADVNIVKNIGLQRGATLHITVGKVQEGRLWIDQFTLPSLREPEYDAGYGEPNTGEVAGKCRYGLVCALIRARWNIYEELPKDVINKWVQFIITGK